MSSTLTGSSKSGSQLLTTSMSSRSTVTALGTHSPPLTPPELKRANGNNGKGYIEDLRDVHLDASNKIQDPVLRALMENEEIAEQQKKDNDRRILMEIANQFRRACQRDLPTMRPDEALDKFLEIHFSQGLRMACHIYSCMIRKLQIPFNPNVSISNIHLPHRHEFIAADAVWDNPTVVTSFIMMLIADKHSAVDAYNWINSIPRGGLATLPYLESLPTTTLEPAYEDAMATAHAEFPDWTVIAVSMIDMVYERLRAVGQAKGFTSFNHSFVMVIGPPGVNIYHGWRVCPADNQLAYDKCAEKDCHHSTTLLKWIKSSYAILSWEEADEFCANIDRLGRRKGKLDKDKLKQVSNYFQRCFKIDLQHVCRKVGPHKPLVDELDIKIRTKVFERFQQSDVSKWIWDERNVQPVQKGNNALGEDLLIDL